jgi:hypothetical protein
LIQDINISRSFINNGPPGTVENGPDIRLASHAVLYQKQAARVNELEAQNQLLTEQISLLKSARRARENVTGEVSESDFHTFYRNGWDMQRRLHTLEEVFAFHETEVPDWNDTLSYGDIDSRFDMIQAELQSIAHCLGAVSLRQDTTIATGSKLESLLRSSLGPLSDTTTINDHWSSILPLADPFGIVHTLALTAIRDWVLQTTFPILLNDGTLFSALYNSFRSIFLQAGMFQILSVDESDVSSWPYQDARSRSDSLHTVRR